MRKNFFLFRACFGKRKSVCVCVCYTANKTSKRMGRRPKWASEQYKRMSGRKWVQNACAYLYGVCMCTMCVLKSGPEQCVYEKNRILSSQRTIYALLIYYMYKSIRFLYIHINVWNELLPLCGCCCWCLNTEHSNSTSALFFELKGSSRYNTRAHTNTQRERDVHNI